MTNNESYILLIEDNPDDVELTKMAFEQNNFANNIEVVKDGQEALEFLFGDETSGIKTMGLPIIILLDLKLPKVDGHEVLKEIKNHKELKRIPVVILTSSKQEEDIIKGYDLGANSYVRKPVSFSDFVNVVNSMGVYWLAVNEKPL
jgi:DNA-binding response OmpR family regulator